MAAVARMEWTGTPIDIDLLDRLRGNWDTIKSHLIDVVDADYHVYIPTGQRMSFSEAKFSRWLVEHDIPPRAKPSSERFARASLTVTLQNKGFREIPSPARWLKSLRTVLGILRTV